MPVISLVTWCVTYCMMVISSVTWCVTYCVPVISLVTWCVYLLCAGDLLGDVVGVFTLCQ